MKYLVSIIVFCFLASCASEKQVSTWDVVRVRRSAEAAEQSAQKTERMVHELQARNARLEELLLELRRKADAAESKEDEYSRKFRSSVVQR